MMRHRIHRRQETKHVDRKEPQETCHNLGMAADDLPFHHTVQLGSCRHHIVGNCSHTQRSMDWSSKGGHMGNSRGFVDQAGVLD